MVEDLAGTAAVSSTPMLASVITASVVSGGISETARTKVVLPTPKPPATTILVEVALPVTSGTPGGTATAPPEPSDLP